MAETPIKLLEGKKKYLEDYLSRSKRNCGVILGKKGEQQLQELIDEYAASIKLLEVPLLQPNQFLKPSQLNVIRKFYKILSEEFYYLTSVVKKTTKAQDKRAGEIAVLLEIADKVFPNVNLSAKKK